MTETNDTPIDLKWHSLTHSEIRQSDNDVTLVQLGIIAV